MNGIRGVGTRYQGCHNFTQILEASEGLRLSTGETGGPICLLRDQGIWGTANSKVTDLNHPSMHVCIFVFEANGEMQGPMGQLLDRKCLRFITGGN